MKNIFDFLRKNIFLLFLSLISFSSIQAENADQTNDDVKDVDSSIDACDDFVDQTKIKNKKKNSKLAFSGDFSLVITSPKYAEAFCKWLTSPTALLYNQTAGMKVENVEQAFTYIREMMIKFDEPRTYIWFVKKNDEIVAEVSLDLVDHRNKKGILRYAVDCDRYNQGIGTKAMLLLLKQAFDILHMHKVYATVVTTNDPSSKIFRKFGFREVGILKDEIKVENGRRVDMYYFELLRKDWDAKKDEYENISATKYIEQKTEQEDQTETENSESKNDKSENA